MYLRVGLILGLYGLFMQFIDLLRNREITIWNGVFMNIRVNNVNLNYEEYGSGKPIILLCGNSEWLDIFDKLIKNLQ